MSSLPVSAVFALAAPWATTAKTALSIVLSLVLSTSLRTAASLFMQSGTDAVFGPIGIGLAGLLLLIETYEPAAQT